MDKLPVALLLRHGDIPANTEEVPIFRGRMDEDLEPEGVEQAKAAAKFLLDFPIKRIVSSPLKRALETAKYVAKEFDLPIEQCGEIQPFNTGFLTGESKEEFHDIYDFYLDNPELVIPRGESVDQVHERIADYFEPELRKAKELTLYACHSSTGVCLANLLNGNTDLRPGEDEVVEPGGVAGIFKTEDGWEIKPLFK